MDDPPASVDVLLMEGTTTVSPSRKSKKPGDTYDAFASERTRKCLVLSVREPT